MVPLRASTLRSQSARASLPIGAVWPSRTMGTACPGNVKEVILGIGVSVFLMAVGAILAWGVDVENAEGFNVNTIGIILVIAGAIGLVVAIAIFGGRRGGTVVREREIL